MHGAMETVTQCAWCHVSVQVGDTLDVEVLRGSATQHVDVTLEPNDA
jgi:hypothetical protein